MFNIINSIDNFESGLCDFRVRKIEEMKPNVETLYAIHANYVRRLMKNGPDNTGKTVNVCGVNLPLVKSQGEFIRNGLKLLIMGL